MTSRRIAFSLAAFTVSAILACGQKTVKDTTTEYLQQTSDRYQQTVDVYTDADAAGNHFAARGEFHSQGSSPTPAMDEISSTANCHSGITCITATFKADGENWGGWYFMNGVLGATDREPSLNWGTQPDAGYDLSGATTLQFWAKGAHGGERVEFFCFGVGWNPNVTPPQKTALYADSSSKVSVGVIGLTNVWKQYRISLAGHDIHYVLGGFGWDASAVNQANANARITFYLDDIQFVKARPADPRFLVSYQTEKSTNAFDKVERNAGFVYDNAVAMIALIAAGDLDRARTIADAMIYAQAKDRFFKDGRLRNAYQGGDYKLPPGWLPNNKPNTVRMPGWYDAGRSTWFEDESQVSSNTGNIAWSMLALLDLYGATHEQPYLEGAEGLGEWVIQNTHDTRGHGGFTGGYDGWENGAASASASSCASKVFVKGQCKRLYKSTEHNIDLFAAFSRLYILEGNAKWEQAAQEAKTFFLSMWNPAGANFWTGTDEGGVNASKGVVPLDIQVWSLEALGTEAGPYLGTLHFVEEHFKTSLGYGFKENGGNACGDHTWFEGTAQVAVAYLLLADDEAKWQSILDDMHSAQDASGGVPATDGTCLNTGFLLDDNQPWEYFPRLHVGATGWLKLAESGVDPFRPDLYETRPPVFSPAKGAHTSALTVKISDATSGALTYYTTNGATPTTKSTPYTSAGVRVSSTETIKAIAVARGYLQSAVVSAT